MREQLTRLKRGTAFSKVQQFVSMTIVSPQPPYPILLPYLNQVFQHFQTVRIAEITGHQNLLFPLGV